MLIGQQLQVEQCGFDVLQSSQGICHFLHILEGFRPTQLTKQILGNVTLTHRKARGCLTIGYDRL